MAKTSTAKPAKTANKAEPAPARTPKGNRAHILVALLEFGAKTAKTARTSKEVAEKAGTPSGPTPSGPNIKAGLIAVATDADGKHTFYLTETGVQTATAIKAEAK